MYLRDIKSLKGKNITPKKAYKIKALGEKYFRKRRD